METRKKAFIPRKNKKNPNLTVLSFWIIYISDNVCLVYLLLVSPQKAGGVDDGVNNLPHSCSSHIRLKTEADV